MCRSANPNTLGAHIQLLARSEDDDRPIQSLSHRCIEAVVLQDTAVRQVRAADCSMSLIKCVDDSVARRQCLVIASEGVTEYEPFKWNI